MKKLFITILILFLLVGVMGFFYWLRNPFSQADLKVEVMADREVDLFETVEYQVRYRNNGNIRLDEATLTFEFPELTIPEEDFSLRNEIDLGSIYPGEEKTVNFSGRLVGAEDETKKAQASIRYQPNNLSAFYESSTSFATSIESVPINFDLELPPNVPLDRNFSFSIDYFSRLNFPLSDLKIKTEYPEGFTFLESNPQGIEETEWEVSLLNQAEGGRIQIRGKLDGEASDSKVFTAILGIQHKGNFIPLKEVVKGTKISDPDLYVFQQINGEEDYTANPGELLHYEIFFRNIGEENFSRLSLINRLRGELFDQDSIKIIEGRSSELDLMWDWREINELQSLEEGEEGMVEFWVEVKDKEEFLENNTLNNNVVISGMRENFSVKVNTKLDFEQKVFYEDEVFGNIGPHPPKAGQKTTYTVNWDAKNFYNDLEDVAVRAELPNNVKLTGEFFPEEKEDQITFDSESREIVWRVGDLESKESVNISFQVELNPAINQTDEATIIKEAILKGVDIWTEQDLEFKSEKVKNNLPHDDSLENGEVE